jgi:hypothetical protein
MEGLIPLVFNTFKINCEVMVCGVLPEGLHLSTASTQGFETSVFQILSDDFRNDGSQPLNHSHCFIGRNVGFMH